MESIEDIIQLREEAIQKLLEEKAQLQADLETLTTRLNDISEKLRLLGHREAGDARKTGSLSPSTQSEYTIEQHLEGKSSLIVDLFLELSEEVRDLGEDVQELPRKHYLVYRTDHNFCTVEVQASKLKAYIDIAHSELEDPKGFAEDCSMVGHYGTGDTRFNIRSRDEIEYAISLIRQAYGSD